MRRLTLSVTAVLNPQLSPCGMPCTLCPSSRDIKSFIIQVLGQVEVLEGVSPPTTCVALESYQRQSIFVICRYDFLILKHYLRNVRENTVSS